VGLLRCALGALLGLLLGGIMAFGSCRAQVYPDKPVRIIVPFPPGGAAYVAPLLLAKHFSETYGQNFLLDPRPGGSTIIGAAAAANSKPDGYTLFAASNSAMSVIQHLLAGKLPYDPEKAFEPVGLISRFPFYLCVPTSLRVTSVPQLIALAKQKPGQLNYASNGNGTVGHIAMEMVKRATGIEISHIPYKSYTQALPDLLSGQVSTMMCDLSVTGAQIQAGNLRLLAVTTAQRSSDFPDVPTLAEVGFPQVEAEVWIGLFAPAGTPAEVPAKLGPIMRDYLATSQAAQDYKNIGQQASFAPPDVVRAMIKRESQRYGEIIRAANIQAE
jgi:tripartite-type tricarboxylate transporter receptor subunit TctC